MEMTFLTMHDLTSSATVLYASDSIEDVLGYEPEEVVGRSCFYYFHPDGLPFARDRYGQSIHFDKAAVLAYCRLKNKRGQWVECECVFTVIYDVFITATTLYKRDTRRRARAGPTFHRHFERPGPLDPRYQMIEHLAPKFISTSLARSAVHEPRAAFLLNRFSQTLPILYATHAAEFVLSCNPDTAVGRSFYEYIDEAYLLGAVNAIERAKENDSIAYLRLLWKISLPEPRAEEDEEMRYEGDDSIEREHARRSMRSRSYQRPPVHPFPERHEVECLVSASSDGLVVVVRHAPPIEGLAPHVRPPGVFASPWATSPLAPYTTIPPPLSEAYPLFANASPEYPRSVPGPSNQDVMNSIRDVTAFTWSISMLNDDVSQDNAADMVHGDGASDNDNLPAPQ